MGETWRILFHLLHKNFIIRKRHWIGTLAEVAVPACIFALIMALRTLFPTGTTFVDTTTIYNVVNSTHWQDYISADVVRVFYVPQNGFTDRIMGNAADRMGLDSSQLHGYETETAMLASYEEQQAQDQRIKLLAVLFDGIAGGSVPTNLVYTVKSSYRIGSTLLDTDWGGPGILSNALVEQVPFVALQTCVDDAFITEVAPNYSGEHAPVRVIQKMPYPPYETVDFGGIFVGSLIAYWVTFMFIVTLCIIPSYITIEKETGVNALVKMNGVKGYQNFLSWLISGMVLGIVAIIPLVTVLKINFTPDQPPLYDHSNSFVLGLALYINLIHTYAFCLHIASYFGRPRLAQGAAVIILFGVMLLVNQLKDNDLYNVLPYLGFLFPNAAAIRIFDEFNDHENSFNGLQWSNIFETKNEVLGIDGTLGFIMISSLLATILHFFIALYLEAVLPGKFGVGESPLFFLKCFRKSESSLTDGVRTAQSCGRPKLLESVADGAFTPGIEIRNLAKSFNMGLCNSRTVEAVRGISLDFYRGEITALLGHNGAGKTTTLSILTGLTAPTAGTVIIDGKDISNDMQKIRDDLGTCPQENILFPDLTVLEHLRLFGLLKRRNKTRKQVIEDVDALLVKLKISEKRNVLPSNLSGGQKRRLCLGIALIGDASILILDEPTSGMDPETSRVTWDIILKYRKQKTIIITTHSMEEADVLGDRIAIMQDGKMNCYGTSMFLKKFYGGNCQEVTLSTEPWCEKGKIQAIIGSEAKLNTATYGRIVVKIPITNTLPETLDKIELLKTELGITGVSVSAITLEEVFLKAAQNEGEGENQNTTVTERGTDNEEPNVRRYTRLTGSRLRNQVIRALMAKKVAYARNHWGVTMAMIFGTLIGIILTPIFDISTVDLLNKQQLNLNLYPNSETLIYAENETVSNTYKEVVEGQGGKGTLIGTEGGIINALLEKAKEGLEYYRNNMIIAAEFNSSGESIIANALYSGSASLSAPITVNTMSNSLLKTFAGDQYSIIANIENLPKSSEDYVYDGDSIILKNTTEITMFTTVFFIVVALFVIHPLLEASTTVKQLQRMTGLTPTLYWGTMFLFDYAVYIVATIVIIIGLVVVDLISEAKTYYIEEIGIFVLLILLFGLNLLLEAYVFSFLKKPLHIVLLVFCFGNIFLSQLVVPIYTSLTSMTPDNLIILLVRRILSLLPHISFTFAFGKFLEVADNNARCRLLPNSYIQITCSIGDPCCGLGCVDGRCEKSLPYFKGFSEDGALDEFVLFLALTPIILLVILFSLEHGVFEKLRSKLRSNKPRGLGQNGVVDSDVAKEKDIIRQAINHREEDLTLKDENAFLAYELSKSYGKFQAVREVNFRVKSNECFGLLGVNGAGKSTTFRMLVGEDFPTSGILVRDINNIKSNRKEYLGEIGYCPQINALIPSFNAFEHLSLFARLRGVPDSEVTSEIQSWIDKLRLNKYAKHPSQTYSGGNKRRLNIAMALIASPELILLDEPTAGVDPLIRRLLWSVLQKCQSSGQAIILTSHSMEECEALCNRLLIMVRGEIVCVGASQQLKQRFGAGYDITVKLNPEIKVEEISEIKKKIQSALDCELRDEHKGYLLYHITDPRTTWVKMFSTMNNLKSEHSCVDDFTVSSATLEQLFIQFARSTPGSLLAAVPPTNNGTTNELPNV